MGGQKRPDRTAKYPAKTQETELAASVTESSFRTASFCRDEDAHNGTRCRCYDVDFLS